MLSNNKYDTVCLRGERMRQKDIVMSPSEVAKYLRVNFQTVYRALREGKLPGCKVGRQWRIKKSDLDQYLAGKYSQRKKVNH